MPKNKPEYMSTYMREYAKNIKQICLPLNMKNTDDLEIWEWLGKQENKTRYIKNLILRDMTRGS